MKNEKMATDAGRDVNYASAVLWGCSKVRSPIWAVACRARVRSIVVLGVRSSFVLLFGDVGVV